MDYKIGAGELRMAQGWGHLRPRVEWAIESFQWDDSPPYERITDIDFGYNGDSIVIAKWKKKPVYLHRYSYGDRIAGYPNAAIALTDRFGNII